ncbi:transglycosylase SLT domain-containing protein [Nocardia alni]|uniref:lytic transglycosylase domain-containing protein n=1 Tax=Nocardia alni TaxID=2815723 RepID=UPI001C22AFE3|nr:transglycosylase SLT domain-containing protein [Nocardia alni]
MTLTIPDVQNWKPDELTTASAAIGKLYTGLDQTVKDSTTKIESVDWKGNAATAAKTRMDLEKTRASAVSQALMGLQKAFTQQVDNLGRAKTKVLQMRDNALHVPAPSTMPAFDVAPDGTVDPQKRVDWLNQHRGKLTDAEITAQTTQIRADAARCQADIVQALKDAEGVAEQAVSAVNTAKGTVDSAYAALGDPATGAGAAAAPAPAPVAPTAVSAPSSTNSTPYHAASYTSHGGGGGSSYGGGGGSHMSFGSDAPLSKPSGNVAQWIAQAKQVLISMGYPPDQINDAAIATIIEHESGGDPNAINNWDSNAAAGHPSKGLMQCIDSTFNQWAAPGHSDIWNPVDNIVAGCRYSIGRYGSLNQVPGVVAVSNNGSYVGY